MDYPVKLTIDDLLFYAEIDIRIRINFIYLFIILEFHISFSSR